MMRAEFCVRVLRLGFASLLVLTLASGCGGVSGTRVSGKVTFKGQPVPAGTVYIKPDSAKGNNGHTGYATISNGAYDTGAPGGQAAPTGAVILEVEGIDPKPPPGAEPDVGATMLFTGFTKSAEVSGSSSVQDIDVPAEAADGPPKNDVPAVVVP
jgi:hypothetical protein